MAELEWGDLKVVLALSRGGSVAGASRLLGVDSSTVSRRLAAAEEALGACLVLRGGREFAFTCEGTTALEAAKAIEASIASAQASIHAAKTEVQGVVRISCTASIYQFLANFVEEFKARHPSLRVELLDADHIVNLAKGEADLAVRMNQPQEPDLIARKAFQTGMCIFASTSYAKTYGLPKTHEELRKHRLILYTEDRLHIPALAWLEQFKGGSGSFTRVSRTSIALLSTMASAGISALPAYEVSEHMPIVTVFPEPVVLQQAFIVYHESQRDSNRIRAVVEGLLECFGKHAAFLSGMDRKDCSALPSP